MKKIETKLGDLYIDLVEENRLTIYDSDKEYIDYVGYLDLEDTLNIIEKLKNIENIYDIVDLGFGENMMWGTKKDIFEDFYDYCNGYGENRYSKTEIKATIYDYMNRVGDTYFIINYSNI